MGTYLTIPNNKENIAKCKVIYKKHFKIKPSQFLNDFGETNTFDDIFGDIRNNSKEIWLKIGMAEKKFYTPEFMGDINKIERIREA